MNEKEIIIQQINNISKNFFNYDSLITHSNNINFKNNNIGSLIKFNILNYVSVFNEIIMNKKYHVLLNDNSLICYHYQFDDNGSVAKHCLYYIPSPSENILLAFQSKAYSSIEELDPQLLADLMEIMERYIRIDYDVDGKKEIIHTNVHMHYGISPNKLRFPIYSKVYPEEFLYFILKYVYESDDIKLEKLNIHDKKSIQLSELEMRRFYINNLLDSEI